MHWCCKAAPSSHSSPNWSTRTTRILKKTVNTYVRLSLRVNARQPAWSNPGVVFNFFFVANETKQYLFTSLRREAYFIELERFTRRESTSQRVFSESSQVRNQPKIDWPFTIAPLYAHWVSSLRMRLVRRVGCQSIRGNVTLIIVDNPRIQSRSSSTHVSFTAWKHRSRAYAHLKWGVRYLSTGPTLSIE